MWFRGLLQPSETQRGDGAGAEIYPASRLLVMVSQLISLLFEVVKDYSRGLEGELVFAANSCLTCANVQGDSKAQRTVHLRKLNQDMGRKAGRPGRVQFIERVTPHTFLKRSTLSNFQMCNPDLLV